jgi:hypothetical protein
LRTADPSFDLRLLKIDEGEMHGYSGLHHFDGLSFLLLLPVDYAHVYATGLVKVDLAELQQPRFRLFLQSVFEKVKLLIDLGQLS